MQYEVVTEWTFEGGLNLQQAPTGTVPVTNTACMMRT